MTDWIFEYVGNKRGERYEYIQQIIASSRNEAIELLQEMDVVWSQLYVLKPAPLKQEEGIKSNE